MLFLGILSLLQCWFLPGLVVLGFSKSLEIKDKIILSPLISLIINYIIVSFLVIIEQFNFNNLILVIIIEVLIILFFYKKKITFDLIKILNTQKKINYKVNLYFFEIFIYGFLILFTLLAINTIGEVVHLGDPVMMWNEWSKEIYNNRIPKSGDYPLAYPILGAITYLILDTYEIEFFARIVCVIYPLWMFIVYFRLKNLLPNHFLHLFFTFLFSLLLIFYIFRHYSLYIGYVDPILVYITFSLGYYFILIRNKKINFYDLLLLSLVIATPAVTKQTGILFTAITPLILFFFFIREKKEIQFSFYIKLIFLTFLFSATWYIYKIYGYYIESNESSNVRGLISQVQGNNIFKLKRGLNYAFGPFYLIFLFLFLFSIKNFYSRIILFFLVIPYFLIWSLLFGNDNRNLAIAIPAMSYVLSIGLINFYDLIKNKINLRYTICLGSLFLIIVSFFAVNFVNNKRDRDYLIDKNIKKQMLRGNNLETNILIYKNLKKNINIKIYIDDYNFAFLPNVEKRIILIDCTKLETQLSNSLFLYSKNPKGICNDLTSEILSSNKNSYQIIFDNINHTMYKFN